MISSCQIFPMELTNFSFNGIGGFDRLTLISDWINSGLLSSTPTILADKFFFFSTTSNITVRNVKYNYLHFSFLLQYVLYVLFKITN